jgi:NAD(P)-dependent dehydrogenase (short-subunit alcohol dehydrogenase family)
MSETVTLDETIETRRPLREAFAYVSDFARIEEWDPAVKGAVRLNAQPPGVGSEYRVDMKAGFSLHYRVIEFVPGRRMVMDVDSKLFTAREQILFSAAGSGTRIRYIATFRFPALLARLSRRFPAVMERVGQAAVQGMKRALDDRFPPPQPAPESRLADRLVLPGAWRFTRHGYRSARRRWNPLSARLDGKHAVVTGATSGIGREVARELAALGADVTLVGRSKEKTATAADEIARQTGNGRIRVELADLERIGEVNALADRLLAAGRPVHILVNNAGALFNSRQLTREGLERSFALLLLSPFVLTERLHPLLAAAGGARVVNVLSGGMYTQRLRLDDLQSRKGAYSGAAAYARAKRGLMIVTEDWAARWRGDGITVNAMHPGWADTPGVESSLPAFYRLTRRVLRTAIEGADTAVWLAAATEAGAISGKLWLDREVQPAHVFAHTRERDDERAELVRHLSSYFQPRSGRRTRRA